MSLSDDHAQPEQVDGAWVTANAFEVLKQRPLLGRALVAADGRNGAEPVVVIGASVWRNRYGSNPAIIGKPVRVNGRPATIVGVMPERMQFPTTANMWAPFVRTEETERRIEGSSFPSAPLSLDESHEPQADARMAVPPAVAAGTALMVGNGDLSDADVDRIARRVVELLGDKAVRDVAWEVVPDLAEVVIKDRLRELESQAENFE